MGKMMKMKIKVPKDAEEFIENRKKDLEGYTASRGKAKDEDLYVGVYAELAVFDYLLSQDLYVTSPDFKMHKKKSHAADLVAEDSSGVRYHVHVKGQSKQSLEKYGHSWLFQRNDPLFTGNKCKGEINFVVCCSVDVENKEVEVMLDAPFEDLKFGECKLVWFQKTKVALYLKDQI